MEFNNNLTPKTNNTQSIGSTTKAPKYFYLSDSVTGTVYRIEIVSGVLQLTQI